eukprot:3019677-Rhodomonas_salina.1
MYIAVLLGPLIKTVFRARPLGRRLRHQFVLVFVVHVVLHRVPCFPERRKQEGLIGTLPLAGRDLLSHSFVDYAVFRPAVCRAPTPILSLRRPPTHFTGPALLLLETTLVA